MEGGNQRICPAVGKSEHTSHSLCVEMENLQVLGESLSPQSSKRTETWSTVQGHFGVAEARKKCASGARSCSTPWYRILTRVPKTTPHLLTYSLGFVVLVALGLELTGSVS